MKHLTFKQLRDVLKAFAEHKGACEDSLADIQEIDSVEKLREFLASYDITIEEEYIDFNKYEKIRKKMINNLTPEYLIDWFESPFISDFDKQRVKGVIMNKLKLSA